MRARFLIDCSSQTTKDIKPSPDEPSTRIRNGVQKPTITPTTLVKPLARISAIITSSLSCSYYHLFLVLHRCLHRHFHHPSHLRAKLLLPSAPCPIYRCFIRTSTHPLDLQAQVFHVTIQPTHQLATKYSGRAHPQSFAMAISRSPSPNPAPLWAGTSSPL